MPNLKTTKEIVKVLKKYEKVYGTFTMRKINGVPAEFSFIIKDDRGQHWHFFTSDFRHNDIGFAIIRETSGPRDFTGRHNFALQNVDSLKGVGL